MAEKIGILGGRGNMGRRYHLICSALGVETVIVDKGENIADLRDCSALIIATPTHFHVKHIEQFASIPILCEKPISFDLKEIERTLAIPHLNLRMINQYEWYSLTRKEQDKMVKDVPLYGLKPFTFFNYYRHGGDGLYWDCINIIGLAEDEKEIELKETSPVWTLWLNGWKCSIEHMDNAYIWNIKSWLKNKNSNHDYIYHAHRRTSEIAKHAYKY